MRKGTPQKTENGYCGHKQRRKMLADFFFVCAFFLIVELRKCENDKTKNKKQKTKNKKRNKKTATLFKHIEILSSFLSDRTKQFLYRNHTQIENIIQNWIEKCDINLFPKPLFQIIIQFTPKS